MISKSAKVLTQGLVKKDIISKKDEEIYIYGIKQFLDFILSLFSTIVIGILFKMLWQSMVFFIAFVPLRRYAGGYHAPNPQICYLMSNILIVISLGAIKQVNINWQMLVVVAIISILLIFIKAPVESKNKPLSIKEKQIYKKYVRFLIILENILVGTFFIIEWMELCMCILVACCMASLLLCFSDKGNI